MIKKNNMEKLDYLPLKLAKNEKLFKANTIVLNSKSG